MSSFVIIQCILFFLYAFPIALVIINRTVLARTKYEINVFVVVLIAIMALILLLLVIALITVKNAFSRIDGLTVIFFPILLLAYSKLFSRVIKNKKNNTCMSLNQFFKEYKNK